MIGETTAIAACLAYIGSLFVLAWWVDRQGERGRGLPANAYIYSLSLCVYATAWTFYGSAGQAAQSGVVFLTPEVGATLAVLLWVVVLRKMVRAARRHHITSIADLAASRYGRSALVGAVLALVAVVGLVPYLALQLKAISASFLMLTGGHSSDQASVPILRDTGFYAAFLMAFFAILFGTRHLSPSERHDGLVAAVAAESLVKLAAFLAVGMFVTFSLYDGPGDLFAQAAAKLPQYRQLISIGGEFLPYGRWFGLIFLSVLAVILLPSQFHMAVIENRDEHHLDRAVWLFPLYLLAINLFVIPAAFAGLMRFSPGSVHPDTFVLALPMAFGPPWLALLVFIGGLSAAIAYAVVTTLTLSIMACNNLLLPALLRLGWIRTLSSRQGGRLVLYLRRCLTLLLLALAYAYLRLVGSLYGLVEIGLTSFVAVAQFAPAVLGGMFWRQGNRRGALAGLTLGFLGWGYTLLLPAFVNVGWLPTHLVREGAFGLAWLKPLALFGLEGMDRISHGLFWSLLANAVAYIGVSLARPPTPAEEKDAARFVDVLGADWPGEDVQDREASALELHGLLARFLGREYADTTLAGFARERGLADWRALGPDAELVGRVEKLLAGAVGAPSARILIDSVVKQAPVSSQEVMRIVEETSHAIAYSHQLEEQSRKLAALADALRESEGRLDAIIDNAPAAIFMKDTGGRYILINRLFEETFHVGREAARGKTDYDIFPAELADGFVRADRQVLAEGRSLQVEETAPGLEGVHTYLTVKFPLRDAHGRIYAVCGIATDITARKRAEEAMAEARARFFGILDIAIDAIISVNSTQSITLFNKGAEAIFGFAAGEAIGQSLDILLPECLQAAHHRHVALFLASPDVTRPMGERLDIVGRRKDGSEFPAAASISKLQLGRETILTVILRDITEAKEAEAAIRALNRDMEIRADQLEALNKELEAFSYSVSHDLRAPLRAIRAFSRMLADGCGDQLGDDERQYLTRILEAGERMSHLIEDLLSLSLANRGEMNRGDVDMSEMARTVAQELRAGQSERQVEFIIEGGVHANGDPRLLRVMLENLLGNAWKYTGKQPAARIEFGTSRLADGGITYFVRDNGAGFDMQYADRLFKAFQRLHGASDFPGTGIGLATTQRIVHRHGGKIWAEGAPEHGATFYFTLA